MVQEVIGRIKAIGQTPVHNLCGITAHLHNISASAPPSRHHTLPPPVKTVPSNKYELMMTVVIGGEMSCGDTTRHKGRVEKG